MRNLLPAPRLVALAAAVICVIFGLQVLEWTESARTLELAGLALAAVLTSGLRVQQSAARDRTIMPPSFVVIFASLLLFGPDVATLVAAASAVTPLVAGSGGRGPSRTLVEAAILATATQIANVAQLSVASPFGDLTWPWRALPTAAAVIAYQIAQGALSELADAVFQKRPVDRSWPKNMLRGLPVYLVGASVAVGLVEVIDQRMWQVLPVVAASLFFAHQTYADYVGRLEEEHRRREVIDFLDQGMAAVDRSGRIMLWNDALERLVGCSRDRVLGRLLDDAVPVLGRTDLPRAITDTLADGKARTTTAYLNGPRSVHSRVLQVKIVSVADGATLLCHDVTERLRAEHELKRSGERLALAAEGANDGLWQWNLQTQEFYVSARWRRMVGLPGDACTGRPEIWLERVHPDDSADLRQALDAHLAGHTEVFQHEHRVRHEDGSYRRFMCRGLAVAGRAQRPVRIAGSLTDTTEQAIAQERLRSIGFLDTLTGLYNRAVFVAGLGHGLDEFRQGRACSAFAVLHLDLDRFKIVNDSLGHLVGDELLVAVARRLESCLRQGDALARLGADEFAVLLNRVEDDSQANAIAFRIQDVLSTPFSIAGHEVFTSASIGIVFGPARYANAEDLMRDADTAMSHAKSRGKARHEVFDEGMNAHIRDRLSLENDLRRAVATNDFEVFYQPIVELSTGMCVGFESLVRWTRNGEPVSPAMFIPIAEEMGLIAPLGTWVMQQACHTFADWQRRFPSAELDCITVNISSRQLMQPDFPRVVKQAVLSSGLHPEDLRVEITETALMDNPSQAAGVLRELRDSGVKVYLDDFGTGYSSLSHLHKLPVDALKIDRSFVKSLLLPDRPAIVESILALARTLETSVVAEGIEEEVQARELERLGCTHAQGFLFSRPVPTAKAEELIRAGAPLGPKRQPESRSRHAAVDGLRLACQP